MPGDRGLSWPLFGLPTTRNYLPSPCHPSQVDKVAAVPIILPVCALTSNLLASSRFSLTLFAAVLSTKSIWKSFTENQRPYAITFLI